MYERIEVAVDGSDSADRAADHAISLAECYGAVVHVIHTLDVTDTADGSENSAEAVEERLPENVGAAVDEAVARAEDAGLEAVREYVEGPPDEAIVGYADRNDIDLVVMGTHGKSGLSRVLLGSTAESVIRNAPTPVLVVRDGE